MSEYRGIARWSEEAVGMINWDDQAKEGTAQVTDETTGTVYEIGGGGESDFSTAQVTVVNRDEGLTIYAPIIVEDTMYSEKYIEDYSTATIEVALYKGSCVCSSLIPVTDVSGNVAVDVEADLHFIVTGDGTVTIGGN